MSPFWSNYHLIQYIVQEEPFRILDLMKYWLQFLSKTYEIKMPQQISILYVDIFQKSM